jgi:hypothetical protein
MRKNPTCLYDNIYQLLGQTEKMCYNNREINEKWSFHYEKIIPNNRYTELLP